MGTVDLIDERLPLPSEAEKITEEIFEVIFPFRGDNGKNYKFPKNVHKPYKIPPFFPVSEPELAPITTFILQPQRSISRFNPHGVPINESVCVEFVIPEELQKEFEKHRKRKDYKVVKNWLQSVYVDNGEKKGPVVIRYGIRIKNLIEKKIIELKKDDKWPCFISVRQKSPGASHFNIKEKDPICMESLAIVQEAPFDIPEYIHKMIDTTYEEWDNIVDFLRRPSKANTSNWKGKKNYG